MNKNLHSVTWILDSLKSKHLDRNSGEELAYFYTLAPFTEPIFGPTLPISIFSGYDFESIKDHSVITIRDGLIPLSYFFKYSKPTDFDCSILIPWDYWFLVPKNWIGKVKLYDVTSDRIFDKSHLPKKIILLGSFNSFMTDESEFEEGLVNLVNSLGGKENIANLDIAVFFTCKNGGISSNLREDRILFYSQKLFSGLKLEMNFPTFDSILSETNYQDALYYEFNSKRFLAETHTKHYVLSRGGGLLRKDSVPSNFKKLNSIRMSSHHSLDVYDFLEFDQSKHEPLADPIFYNSHLKFFKSNTKINTIEGWWDEWFINYVKKNF